jgi:hypothetical protein
MVWDARPYAFTQKLDSLAFFAGLGASLLSFVVGTGAA